MISFIILTITYIYNTRLLHNCKKTSIVDSIFIFISYLCNKIDGDLIKLIVFIPKYSKNILY